VPVIVRNIFWGCHSNGANSNRGNQEGYLTQFLHVSPLDQMKPQEAAKTQQTKVNLKPN
jgi:hypothetical protein